MNPHQFIYDPESWQGKPGLPKILHQRPIFPKGPDYINSVKNMNLTYLFEIIQIFLSIPNDLMKNIICTIDEIWGDF